MIHQARPTKNNPAKERLMCGCGKTLVLGIGNTLLQDEGAGIHVIRMLAERTAGRDDIELMDAAQLGDAAGAMRIFEGAQMDAFVGGNRKRSVHEVSLVDLLMIARLADHLPERRALIGIQPQHIAWGEHPSAAVAAAIPQACTHALQLIEAWRA
jgi:hydrogenase maturation protease